MIDTLGCGSLLATLISCRNLSSSAAPTPSPSIDMGTIIFASSWATEFRGARCTERTADGHAQDINLTEVAHLRLCQQVADVAQMRNVNTVELVHEADVRSAVRSFLFVAEGLHAGDQDLMDLELARRVKQEGRLEARRHALAVLAGALLLGRGTGRIAVRAQSQRLLSVGVAVGHDVRGQAASGRADDAREGVRRNDALATAQPEAGLAKRNNLHRWIVAAGSYRRVARGQKETRGACPIGAPRSEGGRGNTKRGFAVPLIGNVGRLREATRRQTVKKQTSIDLVHNSPMTPISVTFGRRVAAGGLVLALVAGCTQRHARAEHRTDADSATRIGVEPRSHPGTECTCDLECRRSLSDAKPAHHEHGQPGATDAAAVVQLQPSSDADDGSSSCCADRPGRRAGAARSAARAHARRPIRDDHPRRFRELSRVNRGRGHNSRLARGRGAACSSVWVCYPQDADLNALLLQLYTQEVAAYYDPADQAFYIIDRDKPFGPVDQVTTAHEYTHALQDQHFDLEGNRIKDPSMGDAALGQLAVIEGDATLTSQNWMRANMCERRPAPDAARTRSARSPTTSWRACR